MENKYLITRIENLGLNSKELSVKAGWSEGMVNKLKRWSKRVSPEQAVRLEKASNGGIRADKLNPEFFKMLKDIGFERSNVTAKKEAA